ncbi:MAG TPA: homoserine kinase [Candidatus Acidoferrales bacterium]|nr:homoserine kinase [Candidatus Acidoferrales bacterium]
MTPIEQTSFEIRVPASTANLGAGFDCLGLALELFLRVRATALARPGARTSARSSGVTGSSNLPSTPEENLIFRAMRHAAEKEGLRLPPVRLAVQNQIPVTAGLGSSAAATVAGVSLAFAVAGQPIQRDKALQYASDVEGHTDNVGAALLGGLVVTLTRADGTVAGIQKRWPKMVRVIAVTPVLTLETSKSRAVLPKMIERVDAVQNLQRAAMMIAAIEERRYDLLWDAVQDRIHQPYRQGLIPGLSDALGMPRMPGLAGVALSGSGPSVIALATARFDEIGKAIASCFERHGIAATVRNLEAAQEGISISEKRGSRR